MSVSEPASRPPRRMKLPIIEHLEVAAHARELVLYAPELAQSSSPGQFVHVLCGSPAALDPLLRRPFSIHDADPTSGRVSLLYEIRGRGTGVLAGRLPGETLDVLGPLGQGFTLPESESQPLILTAGGIAVAPIYFLGRRIADTIGCRRTTFVIGARTQSLLVCLDKFSQLGQDVRLATDDGSAGYHGLASGLLEQCVEEMGAAKPLVYACGPMPMLKAVAEIAKAHGLKCQVSTEAKMACGIGACMSCVIEVRFGDSSRYVRCCKEGPAFDADEVIW
ncbi:MAG TPA: dihydroorotate dehydrogenase electron transfer subunit [Armatimonadota bacterium]|nr:dihydroorotate dehydrogenase electron transfer subunit [Armatimonadota bacterium]